MPLQKSKKPAVATKPAGRKALPLAKTPVRAIAKVSSKGDSKGNNKIKPVEKAKKPAISIKPAAPVAATAKALPSTDKSLKKVLTVPSKSSPEIKPVAAPVAEAPAKKKPGRPAKSAAVAIEDAAATAGAKRGRKPKAALNGEEDLSDVVAEFEEPVVETTEKVKPLRMKISKAKERALMKEFGLDETVLSEEDMLKRRMRLKTLIKLGKTRGYLTHGEISDHLPDKLVDAETLEVVVNMLNDMGVAVYEQAPDAETLLLNNTGPTVATEEEAEEEAEAALSTVDSEFGRTTDPVRMYMREMGTVELLTREGEIEIAKRIEGGLMKMMEAISESPATIAEILRLGKEIGEGRVVISTVVDGFSNPNEADDYVAEEDFDEFDEEDDDDGKGGSKALTKKLEELKTEALTRFALAEGGGTSTTGWASDLKDRGEISVERPTERSLVRGICKDGLTSSSQDSIGNSNS